MSLNLVWFALIAILYIGFFILEGFDFGVGILLPILGRDADKERQDRKRRLLLNTIGPHWDGNEVWLLTAGGATFAAFPQWYATMFSGFYLALFLLLLALIARGVALEYRSKDPSPRWRNLWDGLVFLGSALPAFLFGVAFGNLVRGVPIDAQMNYVGGFWNLLNPYALLAGLSTFLAFTLYGAIFITLKTEGEVREQAHNLSGRLWFVVVVVLLALLVYTYFETDFLARLGVNPGVIPLTGMVAILLSGFFIRRRREGWAFATTAVSIAFSLVTAFIYMYPRVMISSLNDDWSLTIYNAASNPYTLKVMTIIALIFTPIVLVYQGWSYWVFRKRLTMRSPLVY